MTTIIGTINNNNINGSSSDDTISGRAGNDTLNGNIGNDVLNGEEGNDVLNGGVGNDTQNGGIDNDTYIFGKGDGKDVLVSDYTYGETNILLFKSGITPADITLSRSGNDLVVLITNTTDSITAQNFFYNDDPYNENNALQQIKFNDGTTWNIDNSLIVGFTGSAGNDNLNGTYYAENMNGGAGNDVINGGDGNDTLAGGADNDNLNGNAGDDTYVFSKGDGQDVLVSDYTYGETNTLLFKNSITPLDVTASRSGNDLIVAIASTTDRVTAQDFFYNNDPYNEYNPLQKVIFDDGTVWNMTDILIRGFTGSAGNDSFDGTYYADSMNGGAGNDVLNGEEDNDTLAGGADNDNLNGNAGDDTYVFSKGDGQDVLVSDYTYGETNTLLFKSDIAPSDVTTSRSANDLILFIANTTDSITAQNFFYNDDPYNENNSLQQVKFNDGTTWNISNILTRGFTGSTANDNLNGTYYADSMSGGSGNDILNGGDDNDTLEGSTGNDNLNGNVGDDIYVFGKGDGKDVLVSDYTYGETNTLFFKSGITVNEIAGERVDADLLLAIVGTTDSILVQNFFYNDDPYNENNPLQQIQFSDGTIWNLDNITDVAFGGIPNSPPTGTATAILVKGTEDTAYSVKASDLLLGFSDIEGDDLSIANLTTNKGTIVDNNNGTFKITPLANYNGVLNLNYDVVDTKGGSINATLNLTLTAVNDAPTGTVTITGTAQQDKTLTASNNLADADGLGVISYQWKANNVVIGTGNSYILTGAEVNKTISVVASYTDLQGTKESVSSSATTAVKPNNMGTDGNDVLTGTTGNDTLFGFAGDDSLNAGLGNDELWGGYNNDTLVGGDGNDLLYGEQNNDYLNGGNGNDTLDGGLSIDTLDGGNGSDTYILSYDAVDIIQDSGTDKAIDTVIMPYQLKSYTLPTGIETGAVSSGTQTVNLTGNSSNNTLTGNDGKNTLNGSTGRDSLFGGSGDDILIGGTGNDQLKGDDGKDNFKFNSALKANIDKIIDFTVVDDTIQLDHKIFTQLNTTGVLNSANFITATAANDNNDYIIYNKATGALLYDADGNGAGASIQIAIIGTNLAVTNADFVVV
ncbi:MAG: calcium-binding protein [Methylococcaceae bacterium]